MTQIKRFIHTKYSRIVLAILIGLISFFVLAPIADSIIDNSATLRKLHETRVSATAITAASSGASIALAAIPDDSTTPVAQNIADIADYMVLAFISIEIEEIIFCVSSFVVFKILIPLLCLGYIFFCKPRFWHAARKLILIGILLIAMTPVSVGVSAIIEKQFGLSAGINAALGIEDEVADTSIEDIDTETEKQGFFEKIGNFFSNAFNTVTDIAGYAKNLLSNLIGAVVSIILTTFVIPLLTVIFFWKILTSILGALPVFARVDGSVAAARRKRPVSSFSQNKSARYRLRSGDNEREE